MSDPIDRIARHLDHICDALGRWARAKAPDRYEIRTVLDIAQHGRAELRALQGDRSRQPITAAMRLDVMTRAQGRCEICGDPAEHVDHILPVARYGATAIDNLQALCGPCNRRKGASL